MVAVIARSIQAVWLLCSGFLVSVTYAEQPPMGQYDESECIACHEKESAMLVADWRSDAHGKSDPVVGCVSCHGALHENVASHSRQDKTCTQCHGGPKGAVVHSYSTSKHGVINRIEVKQTDWTKPFKPGNYRVPGCAYCHASGGEHDMGKRLSRDGAENKNNGQARQKMRWVCQHCHGPRFIRELEVNGLQMYELGEMKYREAKTVVQMAQDEFPGEQSERIMILLEVMKKETLKALSLGVAHQSPDYQWWHGHPALDDKLLRIKGELTRIKRKYEEKDETDTP